MAKKKRKALPDTKFTIFGKKQKPFKVSKGAQEAADKLTDSKTDKEVKKKINTKLRVKDQKLPDPKVPKAKVPSQKLEGGDKKLERVKGVSKMKKKKRK